MIHISLIVRPDLLYGTLFVLSCFALVTVKNAVAFDLFTEKIKIHEYLKVNYYNYCHVNHFLLSEEYRLYHSLGYY